VRPNVVTFSTSRPRFSLGSDGRKWSTRIGARGNFTLDDRLKCLARIACNVRPSCRKREPVERRAPRLPIKAAKLRHARGKKMRFRRARRTRHSVHIGRSRCMQCNRRHGRDERRFMIFRLILQEFER